MQPSVPANKTDRGADVNQYSQRGHVRDVGQNMHGRLACTQILSGHVEAQHFRIRRYDKEQARDHRALNHDPRNCLQRISRLGA